MPAQRIKTKARANGRHTALYRAPDGTWLSAGTYGNKAVAYVHADDAWKRSRRSDWVNPKGSRTLLANYAENTFFPNLTVAHNTKKSYLSKYLHHIRPTFGTREMGEILYSEVNSWLNDLEERGVGRATQRGAFVVLCRILKSARRDRLISVLPTEDVQTRPVPERDVVIFHPDEWEKFIAVVPEEWLSLVDVGRVTGLRLEELRALCPKQINFRGRNEIYVDRATIQDGKTFIDKETKGKSNRRIQVPVPTMKILAKEILARGLSQDSEEKIFGCFSTYTLDDLFEKWCKDAGIPKRTPKHLRSTCASWMLKETGGDLARVQVHLGHADMTTTLKYTAALAMDLDDDSVVSFEDYLRDDIKEAK
jgi:integrase